MSTKLDDSTAKTVAAQLGITLSDTAARDAATSMTGLLNAADGHARAIAFEAEPGTYLAAQRRGKR